MRVTPIPCFISLGPEVRLKSWLANREKIRRKIMKFPIVKWKGKCKKAVKIFYYVGYWDRSRENLAKVWLVERMALLSSQSEFLLHLPLFRLSFSIFSWKDTCRLRPFLHSKPEKVIISLCSKLLDIVLYWHSHGFKIKCGSMHEPDSLTAVLLILKPRLRSNQRL